MATFCSEHAYERPAPATLPPGWRLVFLDSWRWEAEHLPNQLADRKRRLAVRRPGRCERCPEPPRFVWVFEGRYHDLETAMLCKRCSVPDALHVFRDLIFAGWRPISGGTTP